MRDIWVAVADRVKQKQLKAIIIETSYTNAQPDKSLFGHLTPAWLQKSLGELGDLAGAGSLKDLPVVISHVKYSLKKGELPTQTILGELEGRQHARREIPDPGAGHELALLTAHRSSPVGQTKRPSSPMRTCRFRKPAEQALVQPHRHRRLPAHFFRDDEAEQQDRVGFVQNERAGRMSVAHEFHQHGGRRGRADRARQEQHATGDRLAVLGMANVDDLPVLGSTPPQKLIGAERTSAGSGSRLAGDQNLALN